MPNGSNAAAAPGRQASWPQSNSTVTMTARVFYNSGEQEARLGTTRSQSRTTLQPMALYKVTAGEVIVKIVMRLHLTSYNKYARGRNRRKGGGGPCFTTAAGFAAAHYSWN